MKKLSKLALFICALGFFFLNLTVIREARPEVNFKLNAVSEAFAQTASANSSATSSITSSVAASSIASSALRMELIISYL